MRLARTGTLALGLAVTLAACAGGGLDPNDTPTQRAAAGILWGGALGAGLGAAFAINPALGALAGGAAGAAVGAASGVLTARPAITYAPIAPAAGALLPGFYDSWAPGSRPPPVGASVPPPVAGAG